MTVTALCPGPTATDFAIAARLGETRLFRLLKPASPEDVARYGYEAMKKGKTVAIHGFVNKIVAFSVRTSPRKLLPVIVRWLHESRGQ